jgi:hypothetical protein
MLESNQPYHKMSSTDVWESIGIGAGIGAGIGSAITGATHVTSSLINRKMKNPHWLQRTAFTGGKRLAAGYGATILGGALMGGGMTALGRE